MSLSRTNRRYACAVRDACAGCTRREVEPGPRCGNRIGQVVVIGAVDQNCGGCHRTVCRHCRTTADGGREADVGGVVRGVECVKSRTDIILRSTCHGESRGGHRARHRIITRPAAKISRHACEACVQLTAIDGFGRTRSGRSRRDVGQLVAARIERISCRKRDPRARNGRPARNRQAGNASKCGIERQRDGIARLGQLQVIASRHGDGFASGNSFHRSAGGCSCAGGGGGEVEASACRCQRRTDIVIGRPAHSIARVGHRAVRCHACRSAERRGKACADLGRFGVIGLHRRGDIVIADSANGDRRSSRQGTVRRNHCAAASDRAHCAFQIGGGLFRQIELRSVDGVGARGGNHACRYVSDLTFCADVSH